MASGDRLAVYTSGDVIMLKRIGMPSEDDFKSRLDETQSRLNKPEMEPERLPCGELLITDGKAIVLEGGVSLPVTTNGQPEHDGSNRSPLSAAS